MLCLLKEFAGNIDEIEHKETCTSEKVCQNVNCKTRTSSWLNSLTCKSILKEKTSYTILN